VERISRRCNRLSKEIQEMLQLANLESSSQHPTELAKIDLAEILRAAVRQFAPGAERRSIAIVTDVQPVWVRGVNDHFVMLFENLISNAVNYSVDGGRVTVSAEPAENGPAKVSIIDEGIGIPAEKIPRIFEQYYRTKEAVAHNKESSGLGLAIVQHIVQLYCVRVCVQSAPQAGTRFDLYFETVPQ
jgi:signal transduction histidine kinase